MEALQHKTVAVIGCGAVGSYAAERIASVGVGHLRLVDHDELKHDNLYRHALGVSYVGIKKAEAMSGMLLARYPTIDVQHSVRDIETVLRNTPEFVLSADVILIALGDETAELGLNQLLCDKRPRLHAWLDPLGVGGHVFATAIVKGPGCFRCLFGTDEEDRFRNRASFAQAGQSFQTTIGGCSGTFTPFGALDADRTALEAAKLVVRILRGQEDQNLLVSWFGDPDGFVGAGFALSLRARQFGPGDCRRDTSIAAAGCPHCSHWKS